MPASILGRSMISSVVCGLLAVAGCRPPMAQPPAPPPPVVTVAKPASFPVQAYYEYNGYLEAVEMVEIRARVKGFLNEVKFAEGDEVKEGDPLYVIDPREYDSAVARSKSEIARAEADMANAVAQVKLGDAEVARLKRLGAAASLSELDKAEAAVAASRAQYDVAVANRKSAEAQKRTAELQVGYTDIRSPIAGRISRTLVTRGNLVGQTDTLLTTIVSVDPVHVFFDVPEKDLVEYHQSLKEKATPGTGTEADLVKIEVGIATEDGYPHVGVLDFRENRVDSNTGTVRIRGKLMNPTIGVGKVRMLYPGLYAKVRVPQGGTVAKMVIPEEALMTGQEGRFVLVIGKDNKVEKRAVTVGPPVWRAASPGATGPGDWSLTDPKPPADGKPAKPAAPLRSVVSIEKGLKPEDQVIVTGLQKARPGMPVAPDVWDFRPPAK